MTVKAVIFDLGGVLVRTDDREPRRRLAESLELSYAGIDGVVFSGESHRKAQVGTIGADEHWRNVLASLGLGPEDRRDFEARFWGGDRLDVALVDFIREMRLRTTTALLSNYWDNLRTLLTDVWRIEDAFDRVFISAELGLAKPGAEIYQHVVNALGVAPEEAVFVDDFPENVAGANDVGLQGILFHSRQQVIADVNALMQMGA